MLRIALSSAAIALLIIASTAPAARAQDTSPYEFNADETERAAVMSVVEDFFAAFAARDSTGMAQQVDLDGRLVITRFGPDGAPLNNVIPMAQFVGIIANREGEPIEETIWGEEVRIMDNLASVWVNYNLWAGEVIDHCGMDNFQLARNADGWRIISVADTQRRSECTPVVRK